MINWEQITYDPIKALRDLELLDISKTVEYPNLSKNIEYLRGKLLDIRDELFDEFGYDSYERLGYDFDLRFGLKLYGLLNDVFHFSVRDASNDEIWMYLSVKVIPDIVHSRWGKNSTRFLNSRRIWLKNLWWYVHLSWHQSEEETFDLLKNNTTDTIMQLVERPGLGYYVELYREIMLQYSKVNDNSRNIFRKVLKLNTALLPVTYPELIDGGIEAYVTYLFEKVK